MLAGAMAVVLAVCAGRPGRSAESGGGAPPADRPPRIRPDYRGLVIPPNIAPLNFVVEEEGGSFRAIVRGTRGKPIEVRSRGPALALPESAWRALLAENRGAELVYELDVQAGARGWRRLGSFTNAVAREEIDPYLLYRKIHPSHNSWSSMGLYQRDLRTYQETPILENRRFDSDCCHCHSLHNNRPDRFTVDIRSETYGNGLLLVQDGRVTKAAGTVGFVAWHPNGRLLACSFNKPALLLHSKQNDMRDIVEFSGWLGCLFPESNVVRRIPGLTDDRRLLTGPTWSPDGRHLYFCSAPKLFGDFTEMARSDYRKVQYDLMRIAYDPERDRWGAVETVLPAAPTGLSAAQPRISPDGRWLSFCLSQYSCWPTYHPESDLYLIDLQTGRDAGRFTPRRMELNSDACESWHGWSANSRWIVFSSKRENPVFNRPHLAYIDPDGRCAKPFVVPQRDPAFYESYLKTYTIPVLATGPVRVTERSLVEAIVRTNAPPLQMPARVETGTYHGQGQ
jgi:hypothetical protein